jgi:hypothetical protein
MAIGDKLVKIDRTGTDNLPLPALPFPIIIGTERMLVTKASTSTWTVSRAQGGTDEAEHFEDNLVMSTPLPLVSASAFSSSQPIKNLQLAAGYAVGAQAQVCIQARGVNGGASTTSFIDVGDPWVRVGT